MSDQNLAAGIGSGHGAMLTLLDPVTPVGGTGDSPMGSGSVPVGIWPGGSYLIRDVQLHEESGSPHDVTHLGSGFAGAPHREYEQPSHYRIGPFAFNVLFDTTIPFVRDPSSPEFNYPNLLLDQRYDWQTYARTGAYPWTNQPYSLGRGPVAITFPLRDPTLNTPAMLTSVRGSGTDTGMYARTGAFVIGKSYGSLGSNIGQVARITMQWAQAPLWTHEQLV